MSLRAYESLEREQVDLLCAEGDTVLPLPVPTIESIGGGSARCMIAEVF